MVVNIPGDNLKSSPYMNKPEAKTDQHEDNYTKGSTISKVHEEHYMLIIMLKRATIKLSVIFFLNCGDDSRREDGDDSPVSWFIKT